MSMDELHIEFTSILKFVTSFLRQLQKGLT
jgi:hypothetical protein